MAKNLILIRYQLLISLGGFYLFLFGGPFRPPIGNAAYPDYPDMKMSATPNPVGSGAKAMGMGGAFISIADDATAASWNPGGLIQVLKPEISIVSSWYSGKSDYKISGIENGDIDDRAVDILHLNYFSFVLPRIILRRNMVFSLNYQHLYEFSMDIVYKYKNMEDNFTIFNDAHKQQRGSLGTFSPAYAIQVTPSLYLGLTVNSWSDNNNGWENINKAQGVAISNGRKYTTYSEVYEKYGFKGLNIHLGFLYKSDTFPLLGKNRRFRVGGVIKTPFNAEITHEYKEIWYRSDSNSPIRVKYFEWIPPRQKLSLKMPLSYGLGFSLVFSDSLIVSIDLYRTQWNQYVIKYPSGKEISPVNRELKDEACIKPTTQIRLGSQYRYIYNPKRISINFRAGLFHDPEPSAKRSDDFYGTSLGIGITFNNCFSFDTMYQYRFGKKTNTESVVMQDISNRVSQHYLYSSLIYYF